MTPEERATTIIDMIWYWLPVRWIKGASWYELSLSVTDLGADISVVKDDAAPVIISFTDAEIIGDSKLNPEAARARIEAV
jgi:hypothetical protein